MVDLSSYQHDPSFQEGLVSFAPRVEVVNMQGVSGNRRGNALENVGGSGMSMVVPIFARSRWAVPLNPAHGRVFQRISLRRKFTANGCDLSSFHQQSDEQPRRGACRKRRRNSERKVPLHAMSCLIQEFFGSIATLLRGTPQDSYAILYRIGNRACCTRSLVS
jgi:hypothetical protein